MSALAMLAVMNSWLPPKEAHCPVVRSLTATPTSSLSALASGRTAEETSCCADGPGGGRRTDGVATAADALAVAALQVADAFSAPALAPLLTFPHPEENITVTIPTSMAIPAHLRMRSKNSDESGELPPRKLTFNLIVRPG